MKYTENLNGYEKLRNTDSCYLDGRYFNKVFVRYPGLLTNPLHIKIRETKIKTSKREERSERYSVHMEESNIDTKFPGLLRLVITTPKTTHSNLLIIDYENEKVYRFEPLGENAPYFETVNDILVQYLSMFFNVELEVVDVEIEEILNEKNPKCKKSGFCTAYIILYAYAFLNQQEFSPEYILKFARMVEETYGSLPREYPEIEYGLFDDNRSYQEGYEKGQESNREYREGYRNAKQNYNNQQENSGISRGQKMALGTGLGALGGTLLLGGVGGLAVGGASGLALGSIL